MLKLRRQREAWTAVKIGKHKAWPTDEAAEVKEMIIRARLSHGVRCQPQEHCQLSVLLLIAQRPGASTACGFDLSTQLQGRDHLQLTPSEHAATPC